MPDRRGISHGFTLADLCVVLVLVSVFFLMLLVAIPRGREQARLAACQKNLGQIGLALALYDGQQGSLPTVVRAGAIDGSGPAASNGPLLVLLETFGLDNFQGLSKNAPPPPAGGPVPGEVPVAGFVCSSDPNATMGLFRAPVSYRAATGDDQHGRTGVFAPGRILSLREVERSDGVGFTAGFSERLVGNGIENEMGTMNYASVSGSLPEGGCSRVMVRARQGRWHGDAGSSWRLSDYRSTLYNHALPPAAPASCVAADGQSAFMGAYSGHPRGVNVLMLDGSVRLVQPTIAPPIWRAFASLPAPTDRSAEP